MLIDAQPLGKPNWGNAQALLVMTVALAISPDHAKPGRQLGSGPVLGLTSAGMINISEPWYVVLNMQCI